MNCFRMNAYLFLILLFAIFLFPTATFAVSLDLLPSVSLDGTWDSNINNASDNTVSDFLLRVTPGATLAINLGYTTLNLSGYVEGDFYAKHSERNSINGSSFLNLSAGSPIALTPNLRFLPHANFSRTDDVIRQNRVQYLRTNGDGTPPTDIATQNEPGRRQVIGGGGEFTYSVTHNIVATLGGNYTETKNLTGGQGLNTQDVSGSGSIGYRVSERFTSGIFLNTSKARFGGTTPSVNTYAEGIFGSYSTAQGQQQQGEMIQQSTSYYSAQVNLGYTEIRQNASLASPEDITTSPFGSLSLTYNVRNFHASLFGQISFAASGSLGTIVQRRGGGFYLGDQFLKNWWWSIYSNVESNRSLESPAVRDLLTANGNADIRYVATEWLSFRLGFNSYRQWSFGQVGDPITRQVIFLGASANTSYKLY